MSKNINIPKSIKVGNIDYKIEIIHLDKNDDGDEILGYCQYMDNVIQINKDASPERQEQTFYHELVHAIFFESSNNEFQGNERLVDSVGLMLHQIVKNNELK
ncbi:ImmA/IrrE family metallo-endopeptidase [Leuconostoc gelidum]|uniref:ImmA/IrrE family metallo-endopeptidase n=1 Tax=Leuconostoc gelidum TaxID=1244 RepID=UPI001CC571EA|nr:ImmA/IrrE family metallo-endopeptidase [Leuconostoc gelidum]MBZ6000949.1 ImmA/IrrE family metallo-endopeptidase [Leuconostoc gelidum subsp. gelidum]